MSVPADQDRSEWIKLLQQRGGESDRSWAVTFWLSLLLGMFGADRFYVGSWLLAILKLLTFGGFGVWWVGDLLLLLSSGMKDENGHLVRMPSNARSASNVQLAPQADDRHQEVP